MILVIIGEEIFLENFSNKTNIYSEEFNDFISKIEIKDLEPCFIGCCEENEEFAEIIKNAFKEITIVEIIIFENIDKNVFKDILEFTSVAVGKKICRGVCGAKNLKILGYKNIDATSGSMNKILGKSVKKDFSPMFLGPVDENELIENIPEFKNLIPKDYIPKTSILFENYWQYGKKFKDLGHFDTNIWGKFRDKGYSRTIGDRHPKGTKTNIVKYRKDNKNYYQYMVASSSNYFDTEMDYITSRKMIYCKIYAYLVKKTESFKNLRNMVKNGEIRPLILDFDVKDGNPNIVTLEFLKMMVNDKSVPFGHGNVLAGLLAGIEPEDYI